MYISDLHTHVRSLYDADIDAHKLLAKIKGLGGKGIAITDHGSLSAIEDYRRVFSDGGLKFVPGCELYIENTLGRNHLVVLAKDYKGYLGISKMVTEANRHLDKGFPVITEEKVLEIAKKYAGHIICLTACMQGVISSVFLQNKAVDEKIAKLRAKQAAYTDPESVAATNVANMVWEAEKRLYETTFARDELKKASEVKTASLEKQLAKTTGVEAEAIKRALNELQNKKEEALNKLPAAIDALATAKKAYSKAEKTQKAVAESIEKWKELDVQIGDVLKLRQPDAVLKAIAMEKARRYLAVFGSDFYMEVQNHGIPEEAVCFPKNVKVARELGIPLVATNDVHILENTEEERLKRQVLRSLRFGEKLEEESIGDSELYIKTQEELAKMLSKILPPDAVRESISNIEKVFDKCDVKWPEKPQHYPKFSKTEDANKLLIKAIREGAKKRFPAGLPEGYKERINYEYDIIKKMGYADYHLIVQDFLAYGKLLGFVPTDKIAEAPLSIPELEKYITDNGWKNPGFYTGLGRGSAAGSLICYCLEITNIDPIKYGLLFERFLNPERVSLPDIDSDLSATTRAKVIEYVQHKYGYDAVCGIMTVTQQAPKGSINMAAKYYGFKVGTKYTDLGRAITKDVPKDPGTSFATLVDGTGKVTKEGGVPLYDYLYEKHAESASREILKWAKIIEGSVTAYGAHAAGIVISDNDDVSDYIPLRMNTKLGMMSTQCDMVQTEDLGLLKMDFLGLTTLDIITETCRMIEENTGKIIDVLKDIPLDDKYVFEKIFSAGKTNAVFQFESNGMKQMLQRFKPANFEDLVILVSMFRPGPLQFIDDVIDVKTGKKTMTFACPELEPILGKTYGAIVYQEQVMQIFQSLAGYSLGGADMVRRAMSKKKVEKLAHEREAFVNGDAERNIKGCVANGISADVANKLFDQMMAFAEYAFNKSHAACYAYTAYITGWLKMYYPAEFIASALNWAELDDYRGLLYEATMLGVGINAPDVNKSGRSFTAADGAIYFGLSSIRGVKDHANTIIAEREKGAFTSLLDFYERTNPNVAVVTNLIDAGAFDAFCNNREAMHIYINDISGIVKKIKDKKSFIASAELVLPVIERSTDGYIIKMQEDAGLKAEIKTVTEASKLQKRIDTAKSTLTSLKSDLNCVIFTHVSEQKDERLKKEYKLLGAYVSEHPMTHYPEKPDIAPIDTIDEGDERVYGIVTDLEIKKRKSDGQEFATFSIEDKSGSIKAVMFVKAYAGYTSVLKEGVVAVFDGECKQDGDDENPKLQFAVKSMSTVEPKKAALVMEISSYEEFKGEIENTFKETYEVIGWYALTLFDKKEGKLIPTDYEVSENVKTLKCVKEI